MGWYDDDLKNLPDGFAWFESFESKNTVGYKLWNDGVVETHVTFPKNGGDPHVTIREVESRKTIKRGYPYMKGYEWLKF